MKQIKLSKKDKDEVWGNIVQEMNKTYHLESNKKVTTKSGMAGDDTAGKLRYDLGVPMNMENPMLRRWASLCSKGVPHYGARNWEKGITEEDLLIHLEKAERHFNLWAEDVKRKLTGRKPLSEEDLAAAVYFRVQGVEYVLERLLGRIEEQLDRQVEKRYNE